MKFQWANGLWVCTVSGLYDAIPFIDFIIIIPLPSQFVIVQFANNFSIIIITASLTFPHKYDGIKYDWMLQVFRGRFCMFLFCMYMHLHLHLMFIRANVCTNQSICVRENIRDLTWNYYDNNKILSYCLL